jgi:pyridoxal 5'-phosphate synthase pdxT subunit
MTAPEQPIRIGVLSLQGDVEEHLAALGSLDGVEAVRVRTPEEVASVDGLVIPGGESTTVGKLMERFGVDRAVRAAAADDRPIFGTCTGMIVLARDIVGSQQPRLGLVDISVLRNAFGRQVDSFEADLDVPAIGGPPVRAVFIRAPWIESAGPDVTILASVEGKPVLAREGSVLVSAFHPELTPDTRVHQYFVEMVRQARRRRAGSGA